MADCQKELLLSGILPSRRFIMNKKMREWPRLEIRKCCETLEHERVLLVPQYFASSCLHASSMFHAGSPARWAFRPSAEPRTHLSRCPLFTSAFFFCFFEFLAKERARRRARPSEGSRCIHTPAPSQPHKHIPHTPPGREPSVKIK